jgi:hypothetical protein
VAYQADEQTDALGASLRVPWSRALGPGPAAGGRGLWERFSSAVEARVAGHWGGWTDGAIEGWHRLIVSQDFRRPLYPRDHIAVVLGDEAGGGISLRSPRLALGDLVLRTQALALEGGVSSTDPRRAAWALSARLDFKAPLGSPGRLGGSGGWDCGVGLLATAELAPWATAHALVAALAYSSLAAAVALQPRTWHANAELSLALRAWDLTFLFEDRVTTSLFKPGWDRVPAGESAVAYQASGYYGAFLPQNRVSVGLRRGRWTAWVSEDWTPGAAPYSSGPQNWFYDSNAPDISIGLAYAADL